MKRYRLEWQREARFNCTVFIEAKNKEEALSKWKDGDWKQDEFDECEEMETNTDDPKIVLEGKALGDSIPY